MPRPTVSANLLKHSAAASFINITTRSGEIFYHATEKLDIGGIPYSNYLISVGGFTETGTQATNRVEIRLSNTDDALGIRIASKLRTLELAKCDIYKIWYPENNFAARETKYFYGGKIVGLETNTETGENEINKYISFSVIPKTTASGLSAANRNLSPLCWYIFKGKFCQYSGALMTCNQQLKSLHGCFGRRNEEHNGGWTNPETPTLGLPTTGGGGFTGRVPCFIKGTPVLTPSGSRQIETFTKGDKIYSFNPNTLEVEVDEVVEMLSHSANGFYEFTFNDNSTLSVTPEHPFLAADGKWICADRFEEKKTEIWRFTGKWTKTHIVKIKREHSVTPVFNLHVKKNHVYLPKGFAAHNAKSIDIY